MLDINCLGVILSFINEPASCLNFSLTNKQFALVSANQAHITKNRLLTYVTNDYETFYLLPNGNLHGIRQVFADKDHNRLILRCQYENGLLQGKLVSWYECGEMRAIIAFRNGLLHGRYTEWYSNGEVLLKAEFINGELNGECLSCFDNGQKRRTTYYLEGKQHGDSKEWYSNGDMKKQTFHDYGEIV